MSLTTQVFILNRDLKGLKLAHNQEKGRRKRGKNIFEQLRAQDGQGGLFWSPQKVKTAVKLSDDKEDAKAMVEASKQLAKEEKQQKKLAQQEEAEKKRQQRQQQREEREAAQTTAKAVKEVAKEASNASRQLNNDLQLSTKKPKRQQHLSATLQLQPASHNIEVIAGPPNPASQRPSRTKRAPAYLDGYQLM
jgi:hypothetical protein